MGSFVRIVHLIKHCHRGNGHVHVAVDLACAQAGAGHDVCFASAGGTYEPLLRASGVTVVRIPDEHGAQGAARSALAVARLVARTRPDVVHAHMMTSAVLARVAVAGRGVPLVTTMHNSFDGHSDLMSLGTVVVAVSEAERDLLLSRGYRPEDVVTVLNGPVGSPRESLDARTAGETEADAEPLPGPSLMTLSGLHARKGVPDVVDAFARLHRELGEWHLHIVGDGPDRAAVEQQITRLGLDGFAHVRGATLTPRGLLEQADIFVSAAHAEPFGLSVAEARAAGCAVVATAVGGVPEVLDHGRAGILVPPGDPDALVDALRTVMVDPLLRREWQDRARWGSDYFSVARMSAEYLALYERLARRRSVGYGAERVLARTVPAVRILLSAVRRERDREQEQPTPTSGSSLPRPGAGTSLEGRTRITYYVPPSPVFAGVERVVHEIASGLATAHGDVLDVHVVYATRYDEPELVDPAYVRHDLGVSRIRAMATSLRATLAAAPPDMLICAQIEPSVVAWVATRGLGIEHFVTHLHGNPAIEENRGSLSTRLFFSAFRHVVSRRVSAVLAVAPSLAEYARRSVTRHAPVYFVMNPARTLNDVDLVPSEDGTFRFVNVARHSYQKGLDTLLRGWALAKPALPSARLTLVGSGPDEPALRELAAELGLDDVVFAGFSADPGRALARADCFVLSSRWEGFPLVLLEALSVGLPVLAADCDFGPRDLITEPALGRLVAVNDPAALAAGLVEAASWTTDPESEQVRRDTAARYRPEAAAEQHFGVLRQIVGARLG